MKTTPRPPMPWGDQPLELPPDLAVDSSCGPASAASLAHCVDVMRLEEDVRLVARPRPPESEHHDQVRDHCRHRLSELGFEVSIHSYGTGENVIGLKPGFSRPEERVVVGAHYDQVERCPGADDNASGVAAVLELARVLSISRYERSLVVACWDEGEESQRGSRSYARDAVMRGDKITLAVALEAVAYASSAPDSQTIPERFEEAFPEQALAMLDNHYRGDFLTVVADRVSYPYATSVVEHGGRFDLGVQVLRLTERLKANQREMHRSDHVGFWEQEVPAMLLTDTASYRNPNVGCKKGVDGPDSLDFGFADRVTRAAVGAIAEALIVR
ncbi:MAG: M28 family peptidase [Myxococcales bacterium]|nr:M28 family peptidase [Myxococcales bacterium]